MTHPGATRLLASLRRRRRAMGRPICSRPCAARYASEPAFVLGRGVARFRPGCKLTPRRRRTCRARACRDAAAHGAVRRCGRRGVALDECRAVDPPGQPYRHSGHARPLCTAAEHNRDGRNDRRRLGARGPARPRDGWRAVCGPPGCCLRNTRPRHDDGNCRGRPGVRLDPAQAGNAARNALCRPGSFHRVRRPSARRLRRGHRRLRPRPSRLVGMVRGAGERSASWLRRVLVAWWSPPPGKYPTPRSDMAEARCWAIC